MENEKQEIINQDFNDIVKIIQESRYRAISAVNTELINLYWQVGEYISKKVATAEWGSGIVDNLAEFLQKSQPDLKGFSRRNLYRMMQFYETYSGNEIVYSLRTQLSWTHHRIILNKTKTMEEKEFYIRLSIKEHYSTRELERQIDSCYFERVLLAPKNVSPVLTQLYENATSLFKDTYIFEFLNLTEPYSESDLQKGLISNLKKFVLEIGKDYAFVGEYYKVQVGGNDYFIDLLFFHRELCCLVAIELKIDDFKPEYLGKMNFYLEALDREIKKEHEKPSVGIILCKSKNSEVVEIALSRNLSPALIAEYETKLIDKNLLSQKLNEFYELGTKDESKY